MGSHCSTRYLSGSAVVVLHVPSGWRALKVVVWFGGKWQVADFGLKVGKDLLQVEAVTVDTELLYTIFGAVGVSITPVSHNAQTVCATGWLLDGLEWAEILEKCGRDPSIIGAETGSEIK